MKHIKIFENFEDDLNYYYYLIDQKEYDNFLVNPNLYCFTEIEMKAITDFLKPGIDSLTHKVIFYNAEIFSSEEEYDQNAYFLLSDEDGLDKTINSNRVNIHCSDDSIKIINPEDFYTKYKSGGTVMNNFSLKIITENKRARLYGMKKNNILFANKVRDEWFLVYSSYDPSNNQKMYKCDQMEGLLKYIENTI